MKRAALVLLGLLAASAAHAEALAAGAQDVPVGSGVIAFEEKLEIGPRCESFEGPGILVLSVFPDASFRAQIDAGVFRGVLVRADAGGRAWDLRFDADSLAFYRRYLEAGARVLCGADVSISGGGVDAFVLKLSTRATEVSLLLRSTATGAPAFEDGYGRHQIRGSGAFVLGLLPASDEAGS
jgi:hypothetical protein